MQNNPAPITMPPVGEPISLKQISLNTVYKIVVKHEFLLRSGRLHRSIETFYRMPIYHNANTITLRGIGTNANTVFEINVENILEIAPLNIRQNVPYIIKLNVPHNFIQGTITNINSGGECNIAGDHVTIHANISDIEHVTTVFLNNSDPRIMLPFMSHVHENPNSSNAVLAMLDAAESANMYRGGKRKSRRQLRRNKK